MAIPDDIRNMAENLIGVFCRSTWPQHGGSAHALSYSVRGDGVTVFEMSANGMGRYGNLPIARFKYAEGLWSLWQVGRNGKWLAYMGQMPTENLMRLIQALKDDPEGVFGLR
ncbi:DUF3024 domain-containing protein [Craterilacuibacter sp.]|uniref:DUF3024 domain-containing protein n=1 Tax=Craterilacuibacter sp. TaxID=2870909 RepID=UPI003F37E928